MLGGAYESQAHGTWLTRPRPGAMLHAAPLLELVSMPPELLGGRFWTKKSPAEAGLCSLDPGNCGLEIPHEGADIHDAHAFFLLHGIHNRRENLLRAILPG